MNGLVTKTVRARMRPALRDFRLLHEQHRAYCCHVEPVDVPAVPPWLHVPPAGVELQPTMNAAQPARISEYKRIFMAFLY